MATGRISPFPLFNAMKRAELTMCRFSAVELLKPNLPSAIRPKMMLNAYRVTSPVGALLLRNILETAEFVIFYANTTRSLARS